MKPIHGEVLADLRALLAAAPAPTTETLRDFTIAYERAIGGAPIAVLYRKSDGQPVLALSAGTTLDRIVAAAAPAPTETETDTR